MVPMPGAISAGAPSNECNPVKITMLRHVHPHLLIAALLTVIAGTAPAGTNHWTRLQEQLASMGLTPDPATSARITTLALVQTADAFAREITAAEQDTIRLTREGLITRPGFRLGMTNGLPFIRDVETDSPAAEAGLLAGDVITGIGTNRLERIALPAAQRLLMVPPETTIALRILRGGTTSRVDVIPAPLPQPAIELAERLPNGIGYVKINGLFPGSGRDLVSHIRAWSETGQQGIILDVRGAGGHDDASIQQVAGLFAAGGQFLFAYRDHHQNEIASFRASESRTITTPVMVLIDRHTRGAAETLAAVLNHAAPSALLIGETSAGDFNLRDAVIIGDSLLYMTTRVLDTADGIRYNGQFGIAPAVNIPEHEQDTRDYDPLPDPRDNRERLAIEERDAAMRRRVRGDGILERAVDILIGLKTLQSVTGGVSSSKL